MHEAMLHEKISDKKVRCSLCYRRCVIPEGKSGFCGIRKNVDGKLYALTYGKASAYNVDPIEKKPFYHFWPGSYSYSISTVGCNFACLHCCNPTISQAKPGTVPEFDMSPKRVVEEAKANRCAGLSYTYTEPTVFFEYCYDIGILGKKEGLYNTFVTNGYATPEAVKKSTDFLDAARIDLKGDEEHYQKICGGVILENVLECIKNYYKTGMHIEIITLVIPEDNDNKDFVLRMADFIKSMNDEIPWHFIRFFPSYKMLDVPPTNVKTLEQMHDWAVEAGIKYVYSGNVPGHRYDDTYCHNCGHLLIQRHGFSVSKIDLTQDKKCPECGTKIPIVGDI